VISSTDRTVLLKFGETPSQPSPTMVKIAGMLVRANNKLIKELAINVNFHSACRDLWVGARALLAWSNMIIGLSQKIAIALATPTAARLVLESAK
jgi:hypothetical protein